MKCIQPLFHVLRQPMTFVFIGALVLRLLFGIMVTGFNSPEGFDSEQYIEYAQNLLDGKGYVKIRYAILDEVRSVRMPLYPLFLAGCFKISGFNFIFVRILQCLMGALLSVQVFLIAKMVFNRKTAFIASVIAAVYPNFLRWTNWIATETLFIFLLMWGVYLLIQYFKTDHVRFLILSGIFLGLSVLTRATSFTYVILLFPVFLIHHKLFFKSVQKWGILFGIVLLILSPWSIRNTLIHGHFVPLSTQSGLSLWRAVGPGVDPVSDNRYAPAPEFPDSINTEYEWDRFLKQKAMEQIKKDPVRFLKLLPKQFVWMWHLSPHFKFQYSRKEILNEIVFMLTYYPLLICCLIGVILTRKQRNRLLFAYLIFLNFTAIHIVFVTAGRYRLPIMPFVMMFAAAAIAHLPDKKISVNQEN
ncbi:glycosyltransferase family 39 protein [bacterium]|nr:glycosyltransferase family 39 protein [bacterium]